MPEQPPALAGSSADQDRAMALPRVMMDQGHARLHYRVPMAILRAGLLSRVFCDYYCRQDLFDRLVISGLRRIHAKTAERVASRYTPELPQELVYAERLWTLIYFLQSRIRRVPDGPFWDGWTIHRAKAIRRQLHHGNVLHGYISSLDPPLLTYANSLGIKCTGDQIIAPVLEQHRQARIQTERYPGYAIKDATADHTRFRDLELRTWPELSAITCPSAYVKDILEASGVERSRITVIPYPFDAGNTVHEPRPVAREPLVVGCVGTVELRKGVPYFFEVAKRLASPSLKFRMVGPIRLDDKAIREARPYVEFVGGVPRSQVMDQLRAMDILLFPSTCEGSAGVLYEASSVGLPIVTSPNSGTHLEADTEALITAYDDLEGLCASVSRLVDDPGLRRALGEAGRKALRRCSLEVYSAKIGEVFRGLFDRQQVEARLECT